MGNKHVKSASVEEAVATTAPDQPPQVAVTSPAAAGPQVVNGVEPAPQLTEQQVEVLLETWKELEGNIAKVGVITFIRLENLKAKYVLFVCCISNYHIFFYSIIFF